MICRHLFRWHVQSPTVIVQEKPFTFLILLFSKKLTPPSSILPRVGLLPSLQSSYYLLRHTQKMLLLTSFEWRLSFPDVSTAVTVK